MNLWHSNSPLVEKSAAYCFTVKALLQRVYDKTDVRSQNALTMMGAASLRPSPQIEADLNQRLGASTARPGLECDRRPIG